MIVREEGEQLLLVRQSDHAMLSGWLAAAWGAPPWDVPSPYESVVLGARLHDLAWTPFDEALARRPDGRPYAFLEVSRAVSTQLYLRGLDAVESIDAYAGLLASLHYTGFYHSHWGWLHWNPNSGLDGEEGQAVDRFVDHELGRQQRLRERLGVGREQDNELKCNYFWLQLWDRISLDVCRHGFSGFATDYPATPLTADPGAGEARLHVSLEPGGACRLDPYPLRPNPYRARVPCVRLPLSATGDLGDLRRHWLAGGGEAIEVTFLPGR